MPYANPEDKRRHGIEYYLANRTEKLAYEAERVPERRPKKKVYDAAYRALPTALDKVIHRRGANLAAYLHINAKVRARKGGLPFSIGREDIHIPTHCPVFGVELALSRTGRVQGNSPTLDRIKPELGYVPGNVVVISWEANRLKNNATWRQMRTLADFYERLEKEDEHA